MNNPEEIRIYAAPLQGYTTAVWRHVHATECGGVDAYFSPFVRVENGEARSRDLRDVTSPLNAGLTVAAQAIFGSVDEWITVCTALREAGARSIDLNLGCPFPPQMNRRRGAAMVADTATLHQVGELMRSEQWRDVKFSLKMRLGRDDASEWRQSVEAINRMPLTHLTVHPRVARQQYRGNLLWDEFASLTAVTAHRVVVNGELTAPQDVARVMERFPQIAGVMLGRGLLARPTLATEIRTGSEMPLADRLRALTVIHSVMLDHYQATLCGEAQVLTKIKAYWDYAAEALPRNQAKALRKATTLAKYKQALLL